MNKFVFAFTITMFIFCGANAQVKGATVGLRLANEAQGAEISLQLPCSTKNRIELDLGLNNLNGNKSGFELSGVYQWVWKLNQVATGLNWYAGLGATVGTYSPDFGIGLVGQIGLEYNFNIPLQISLDWRPTLFNSYYTYYGGNGLSIRYRF